ncbi:MAG TPA: TMEM175 family protein [Candidatus Nanopelagicales bacterium]|nr:TMEM175 family protein [Candidatus Nanopelagicales bacterium]
MTRARRYYPTERLGALTDGVFAIALTLLVLEIQLPDPPPADLTLAEILRTDWHPFLGWLISFVVLARLWLIQHETAATLTRASSRTLIINMVFLGTISLIPFSANLVSVYELDEPLSKQIFALLIGLSSLVLGWFVRSAEHDQATAEGRDPKWSRRALHHLIGVPIIAAVAAGVTFIDPALSLIVWGIESVVVVVVLLTSGQVDEPSRA